MILKLQPKMYCSSGVLMSWYNTAAAIVLQSIKFYRPDVVRQAVVDAEQEHE